MIKTEIQGSWKKQKAELKRKFAYITDNDLIFSDGGKEELIIKLQKSLGKTREEMRKIFASL